MDSGASQCTQYSESGIRASILSSSAALHSEVITTLERFAVRTGVRSLVRALGEAWLPWWVIYYHLRKLCTVESPQVLHDGLPGG